MSHRTSNHLAPRRHRIMRRRPSQSGFSLIEVMIALIVFSIGALALGAVIPFGSNRANDAGNQTRGSELASETAEHLLTTPYGDSDLLSGAHLDPNNPYKGGYYVQWSVEVDQPIVNCKRITVSISRHSANDPVVSKLIVVSPDASS